MTARELAGVVVLAGGLVGMGMATGATWTALPTVTSEPTPGPLVVTVEVTRVVLATAEPTATVEPTSEPIESNVQEMHIANEPTSRGERVRWTDADVRDALDGAPLMVQRIVFCEVGRSGEYRPYAVGSLGEVGPAQLLPGAGNGLAIFYRWGFTDPNSPYEARQFIERVMAEGMLNSQYPRTSQGCAGSV